MLFSMELPKIPYQLNRKISILRTLNVNVNVNEIILIYEFSIDDFFAVHFPNVQCLNKY